MQGTTPLDVLRMVSGKMDACCDKLWNGRTMEECDRAITGQQQLSLLGRYLVEHIHESPECQFWQERDFSSEVGHASSPPAHLIGGWYDFFLREVLADYERLRAAGHTPYLTIGAWMHFDPGAALTGIKEALHWFNQHLKVLPMLELSLQEWSRHLGKGPAII